MVKNKNTNFNAKAAFGFILHTISDFNYEPIRDFIDNLDFELEGVKLKVGLGFAHKKIYLDLLEMYHKDIYNGHLTLYVLLHEVGHMFRLKEDKKLEERINTNNFNQYFEDVLIEEAAAHEYAIKQFKLLTGVEVNEQFLNSIPDINTKKTLVESLFNKKQTLGSWDAFKESIIDRDFVFRTLKLKVWNNFTREERHIRACINGDYYNPFDIPKDRDLILINPYTFVGVRANGESMDDYNGKDIVQMNPFNSRYDRRVSYENGKVAEAYKEVDGEWVELFENEDGEWVLEDK